MSKYAPRLFDVIWTEKLIDSLTDGGVWALPMNGNIYRIDKAKQTLTLTAGVCDDVHHRVEITFGHLGYEVTALPSLHRVENN